MKMRDGVDGGQDPAHDQPVPILIGGPVKELSEASVRFGMRAERLGELQQALFFYRNAVAANPDSAIALYNYGDVLLALDRTEEALPALERAVQLAPEVLLYRYDLGLALCRLGRHEDAQQVLADVVMEDHKLKRASSTLILSAMYTLAFAEDALGQPLRGADVLRPGLKVALATIYRLGRMYLRGKKPKEALRFFKACVELEPNDEPSIHGLGSTLLELGRHEEAIVLFRRAIRLDPKCENAWYDLGLSLAALKQHRKARSSFKKALLLKPDHCWAHYCLACLDALENRPDAAFLSLDRAMEHGFRDLRRLRRDQDLASLRRDHRWRLLLKKL